MTGISGTYRLCAGVLAIGVLAFPLEPRAETAESLYQGKNVKLIIPYNVGGGYDGYARLAGRYLGQHLPGRPRFVAQNMPGAGGLTGTKFLFEVAEKDGSVIGIIPNNLGLRQLLGEKNLEMDARKLNWVGRLTSSVTVYYTWHTSPTKSFDDLRTRETITGGSGGLSNNIVFPLAMNEFLGAKIKLIRGFRGSVGLDRALERGEIEMSTKPWQSVKSGRAAAWLRDKQITMIVQFSRKRQADLPNVPAIFEFVKGDAERRIFSLLTSPGEIGRAVALPPGVPEERVKWMRAAFDSAIKDPDFKAEAKKLRLEIDPLGGEELQQLVAESLDIPPAVVERVRKILR